MKIVPTKYQIRCIANGELCDDNGWILDYPDCCTPSMVRAEYSRRKLHVKKNKKFGLYRYANWLPVKRILSRSAEPITFRSKALAKELGLRKLYITFNGYWPEIGALMRTCSFKELEAYSVCSRLGDDMRDKVLVVSSAGNTARAFAQVCSDNNIKLLLTVPEDNLGSLWFEKPLNPCVKLISTESGSDYFDAINLGNIVCELDGFLAEGGAKNIARRDGMGTTMLSATTTIGRIPDYYFQAVGSGTGAIAAWEANLRFINDGRYGKNKARLMVTQNEPFTPIYDAWKAKSRALLPYDPEQARKDAACIYAPVLSNRKPPYSITGGLYDALMDTNGDVLTVTNQEAMEAGSLFEKLEGIDLNPAAAAATASLIKAVRESKITNKRAIVMLNVTGGGEKLFKATHNVWNLKPDRVFSVHATKEEIKDFVLSLEFKVES